MSTGRHPRSSDVPGPARPALVAARLPTAGPASLAGAGQTQAVFGVVTPAEATRTSDNRAAPDSVHGRPSPLCRSVFLSFRIVTMAGTDIRLNASSLRCADHVHRPRCQAYFGAYQFIVSTPRPFTLRASDRQALADIHRKLDAVGRSLAPDIEIRRQADGLAAQVTVVLRAAAARVPRGPGVPALTQNQARVTVYRYFGRG
ncbi:hypothetical protein [Streptacidiphilus jiangxiensis]|uniref:Uncharacterized protein n=1 Tax=Streptacidiphilus jiangxiensis TaxID=235985 RepID=A0A1H7TJT6_STRJI|nr:hypothetical protein [Streptacidiphilus jiangxiensis]SEL85061.1 hypothetical protein SAMN05414137_11430 [Streptacidiphilus jiangxiensis]